MAMLPAPACLEPRLAKSNRVDLVVAIVRPSLKKSSKRPRIAVYRCWIAEALQAGYPATSTRAKLAIDCHEPCVYAAATYEYSSEKILKKKLAAGFQKLRKESGLFSHQSRRSRHGSAA